MPRWSDPGVDLVTAGTAQLEDRIAMGSARLSPSSRNAIENLIRRDHAHSEKRRSRQRRSR